MSAATRRRRLSRSIARARGWLADVDTGGDEELRAMRRLGHVFADQADAVAIGRPIPHAQTVTRPLGVLLTATGEEWDLLATALAFQGVRLVSDGAGPGSVQQLLVDVAASFAVDSDISIACRLLRAAKLAGDRTPAIECVEDYLVGCQFQDGHFGLLPSAVAEVSGADEGVRTASNLRVTVEVLSSFVSDPGLRG